MNTISLWPAIVAACAALAGVAVSVVSDAFKDRRRTAHDLKVRQIDRAAAASDRRRTFEIDNLQSAYDGLWLLTREMAKMHMVDARAAETERGYGGTQLPDGAETDIALTSQAAKSIRLILDDEVRALAQQAQAAMTDVGMLGVNAKIFKSGPVSAAEGEYAHAAAVKAVDQAMNAIADRLRLVVQEETPQAARQVSTRGHH